MFDRLAGDLDKIFMRGRLLCEKKPSNRIKPVSSYFETVEDTK